MARRTSLANVVDDEKLKRCWEMRERDARIMWYIAEKTDVKWVILRHFETN